MTANKREVYMKISVVVTVYNLEKYVEQCLDSIIAQTYSNLEIIVVDDGSTDGSSVILDDYLDKDNRVSIYHKDNEGLVKARQYGVKRATGDYVTFVDGDDWIEPNMYECMVKSINDSKPDIIAEGYVKQTGDISENILNEIGVGYYDKNALIHFVYPQMLCTGACYVFGIAQYVWNKLYKKDLITAYISDIDSKITDGEDVALVFPVLLNADSLLVLDGCHYHYRVMADSMSHTKKASFFSDFLHLRQHLEKYLLNSDYAYLLRAQFRQYELLMMINGLRELFGIDCTPLYDGMSFDLRMFKPHDRVILYGAGAWGQAIYKKVINEDIFIINSWVDENKAGDMVCSRRLEKPENALESEFDYILIAIKDHTTAVQVIQELENRNVPPESIIVARKYESWNGFIAR